MKSPYWQLLLEASIGFFPLRAGILFISFVSFEFFFFLIGDVFQDPQILVRRKTGFQGKHSISKLRGLRKPRAGRFLLTALFVDKVPLRF